MSTQSNNELASFHQFIGQQLGANGIDLSPEQALELWREENPGIEQQEEDREAILEALAQLDSGEQGLTIEEFDHEFRRRNNLGPRE